MDDAKTGSETPTKAAADTYWLRPKIQYQASCAILCRAGKDLGCTMTGHHDFQLADDIIHKVHIGHYTFYSVAVVKNDKLFIKARGVFSRKYIGGEGTTNKDLRLVSGKGKPSDDLNETATKDDGDAGGPAVNTLVIKGDSLFSDDESSATAHLLVKGTYVALDNSYINPLGFGPYTYQGCKAGREGRGMPLHRDNTVEDIKRVRGLILGT